MGKFIRCPLKALCPELRPWSYPYPVPPPSLCACYWEKLLPILESGEPGEALFYSTVCLYVKFEEFFERYSAIWTCWPLTVETLESVSIPLSHCESRSPRFLYLILSLPLRFLHPTFSLTPEIPVTHSPH